MFCKLAFEFAYGKDSVPLLENRIGGVQTLSGTGGLRVMGEMLRKHGHQHIYVPNPTWGNHIPIFRNSGLEVRKYSYYNNETSDLDFDKLIQDIQGMPAGSCILLHACAHNPTGYVLLVLSYWKQYCGYVASYQPYLVIVVHTHTDTHP